MGFFKNILEKLGIKKAEEPAAEATPGAVTALPKAVVLPPAAPKPVAAAPTPKPVATAPTPKPDAPAPRSIPSGIRPDAPVVPARPAAIPVVDVMKKFESLAAANPEKLDWKVSIVDLLKLLGIDSSYEARKELATELECPAELMRDSAKMNTWLHKTVLKKIAENGGNIPSELLD